MLCSLIAAWLQFGSFNTQKASSQVKGAAIDSIAQEVATLINIPNGEQPTMADVTDASKLSSQPFFQNAENGDKVLVYELAKKVVLYRPDIKKIIEIAPLSEGSSSSQLMVTDKPIALTIRNGTGKAGLAGKYEQIIKKQLSNLTIRRENANKTDYDSTVVLVLDPTAKTIADKIISQNNWQQITSLPEGEKIDSKTQILIILGKNSL